MRDNYFKYYGRLQLVCDLLSVMAWVAAVVWLALNWAGLPETVPTHYSFSGAIDGWGSKSSLLFLPLLAAVLFAGITAACCFPRIWNLPVRLTEGNRQPVLTAAREMMGVVKLSVTAMFCLLSYTMINAAPLPPAVTVIFLLVTFGAIIYYSIRMKRIAQKIAGETGDQ